MLKSASVSVLSQALTPVVHNEVMELGYSGQKGEAKRQRRFPVLVTKEGRTVRENVPVVSGNANRGLERRLLIDRSLDILDLNMDELLGGKKEDVRRVTYFLRNGGLTPGGIKADRVSVGTYHEIQTRIPFLLALGGVYNGHHFEGSVKVGISQPMTVETLPLYAGMMPERHRAMLESAALPSATDLVSVVRYTRRAAAGERGEDKESMIYGTEAIAAGTYFYSFGTVVSHYDSVLLTFRAMYFLLGEYGYVGGMTGRGHGRMTYDILYTDEHGQRGLEARDYEEYVDYLKSHRDEILAAIREIPQRLTFTGKEDDDDAE